MLDRVLIKRYGESMRTFTLWLGLLLTALPCAAINEEFMIGVSTDRKVYRLGDMVEITGTVTNATTGEQYLWFSGNFCSSYEVWIESSQGEVVAEDHRFCLYIWEQGAPIEPFSSWPLELHRWDQSIGDYGAVYPPPTDLEYVGPGTYRVVVRFTSKEPVYSAPFVICDGECPEPRSVVIPGAGNNPGLHGTSWSTDLLFQGLGGGATVVSVSMFEHGSDGVRPDPVEVVVPDFGALQITNVLDSLFSREGPAALLLEIRGGDLHVSSRTFNTTDTGTFGQAVPAIPADTGRQAVLVPGLRHKDGVWRTNLGLINLLPYELVLDVVLNTGEGSSIPIGPVTLGPYEYLQVNDIFRDSVGPQQEILAASAWISRSDERFLASFLAYGSVIDNRTGDAVFVRAEPALADENPY